MQPLLTILRAAHCRSTHHYFALDALPLVQTDGGKRLVGHLLEHYDRYLTGAKDPDTRFRDFQNHVVHVADGYWGGAPRVAHQWYDRMQRAIDRGAYDDAAYAAGVMSHYFTDPIQPLHTDQTPREAIVHRPLEWSINQSYQAIFKQWQEDELRIVFQLADGSSWIEEAILYAARFAHRKYSLLVDSYRLEEGIAKPVEGLTADAKVALSELFGLAITGWARVLERAAWDAEARMGKTLAPSHVMLSTVLAAIQVPARMWLRRIESKSEREALESLLDEYQRTGTLVENLPDEVDVKQRVAKVYVSERAHRGRTLNATASETPAVTISATESPVMETVSEPVAQAAQNLVESGNEVVSLPFIPREAGQPRLALDAPVVDAPSIGPKTATRFVAIGVETIGQFLAADATDLADQLATSWITVDTVRQWQAQTLLMTQFGLLRVRDVQLLVGAGYSTPEAIASRPADALHREIERFAMTTTGARYRRGAEPPTFAEVQKWHVEAARFCGQSFERREAA